MELVLEFDRSCAKGVDLRLAQLAFDLGRFRCGSRGRKPIASALDLVLGLSWLRLAASAEQILVAGCLLPPHALSLVQTCQD